MNETRPAGILETALYVDDLEAAKAFYGGLLGLEKVLEEPGRHVFFRCGESMLLLFNATETVKPSSGPFAAPPHGAGGAGHICFAASNAEIDEFRDRLVGAGLEIECELTWPNGARSMYVRDPAGNSVEFAEPKLWGFEAP
jgi:catechol 2,3-dioxygenase-like lactoylglutathione lyase family enzyme